jgi:hypothetical protein
MRCAPHPSIVRGPVVPEPIELLVVAPLGDVIKIVGAGLCLSADSSMARGEKCGGSQLRERAP